MRRQYKVQSINRTIINFTTTIVLALGFAQQASTADKSQGAVQEILSLEADVEYGEYLAGECLTCHQATGATPGVPLIVGLPAEYFVTALLAYKDGTRDNQVMELVGGNLGSDEMAALALYFSTMDQK